MGGYVFFVVLFFVGLVVVFLAGLHGEYVVVRDGWSREVVFRDVYGKCFSVRGGAVLGVRLNGSADIVFRFPNGSMSVFNDTDKAGVALNGPGAVCLYIYGDGVYASTISVSVEENIYVNRYGFLGFIGAVVAAAGVLGALHRYWSSCGECRDVLTCGSGVCRSTGFTRHECVLRGVQPENIIKYLASRGFKHRGKNGLHIFSGKLSGKIKQITMHTDEDRVKLTFIYRGISSSGLLDLKEVCGLVADIYSMEEGKKKKAQLQNPAAR